MSETPEEVLEGALAIVRDFRREIRESKLRQVSVKSITLETIILTWIEQDAEMRTVELLCGESYRWSVKLHQVIFVEPGEETWKGEGSSYQAAMYDALMKWGSNSNGEALAAFTDKLKGINVA